MTKKTTTPDDQELKRSDRLWVKSYPSEILVHIYCPNIILLDQSLRGDVWAVYTPDTVTHVYLDEDQVCLASEGMFKISPVAGKGVKEVTDRYCRPKFIREMTFKPDGNDVLRLRFLGVHVDVDIFPSMGDFGVWYGQLMDQIPADVEVRMSDLVPGGKAL